MSSFDHIMQRINETSVVTEKTAGVQAPALPTSADAVLAAATALSTKTAGAQAPALPASDALSKMAAETAATEEALRTKHASALGAAFCDGFVARMGQYDAAIGTKVASASAALSPDLVTKIANDAFEAAYVRLEKQAAAEFEQGRQDGLKQAHELATAIHLDGQQAARNVIAALAAQG